MVLFLMTGVPPSSPVSAIPLSLVVIGLML